MRLAEKLLRFIVICGIQNQILAAKTFQRNYIARLIVHIFLIAVTVSQFNNNNLLGQTQLMQNKSYYLTKSLKFNKIKHKLRRIPTWKNCPNVTHNSLGPQRTTATAKYRKCVLMKNVKRKTRKENFYNPPRCQRKRK